MNMTREANQVKLYCQMPNPNMQSLKKCTTRPFLYSPLRYLLLPLYLIENLLGLIVDPVIEAIARLEFEDGLRMGVLPGGCWYPCGSCT